MRKLLHATTPYLDAANTQAERVGRSLPFPPALFKAQLVCSVVSRHMSDTSDQPSEDIPIIWHSTVSNRFKLRNRYVKVQIDHHPDLPTGRLGVDSLAGEYVETIESGDFTMPDFMRSHANSNGNNPRESKAPIPRDDFWSACCKSGRKGGTIGTCILRQFAIDYDTTCEDKTSTSLCQWVQSPQQKVDRMNIEPFYESPEALEIALSNAKKAKGSTDEFQWNAEGRVKKAIEDALENGRRHQIVEAGRCGMTPNLYATLLEWRHKYNSYRDMLVTEKVEKYSMSTKRKEFVGKLSSLQMMKHVEGMEKRKSERDAQDQEEAVDHKADEVVEEMTLTSESDRE